MDMLILFGIFLLGYFLIVQNPDFFFWLLLIIFFDPGGYFSFYFGGKVLGAYTITDVLIIPLMLCLSAVRAEISQIRDTDFRTLIKYLFWFLTYYIIVFGIVTPALQGRLDYSVFFVKQRELFYIIPLAYSVYIFAQRGVEWLFQLLISTSIIVLVVYVLTLISGIELIGVNRLERYYGSGIERIFIAGYGLTYWILGIGMVAILVSSLLSMRSSNKLYLYFAFILLFFSILLTLTRREFLNLVTVGFLSFATTSFIIKGKNSSRIVLTTTSVSIVVILLSFTFPEYMDFISKLFSDLFSLLFTGIDSSGRTDYRVTGTGDLEIVKQIFFENPLLGVGYIPGTWTDIVLYKSFGSDFGVAYDAAGEVPIYGVFFNFGIIGVIVMLPFYYLLLRKAITVVKKLRNSTLRVITVDQMLIIFFCVMIFNLFVGRIYALSSSLQAPEQMFPLIVAVSILYALAYKYERVHNKPI